MAKLIAKRYEIVNEFPPEGQGFRRCLGQDHQSADQSTVQIKLYPRPKHLDLVHSIFESRAKELCQIHHPALERLVDYGYDGKAAAYYLVYEDVAGRPLDVHLPKTPVSFGWSVDALLEICETLNYLHSRGMTCGNLDASRILLQLHGQLPLCVTEPCLSSIEQLLVSGGSVDDDPVQRDIAGLGKVAAQLLTRILNPTGRQIEAALAELPPAMRDVVNRALSAQDGVRYQSAAEAARDLRFARSQDDAKTKYYLEITRNAVARLRDMGFIAYDAANLAVPFLNEELRGEVFGRAIDDSRGGIQYSLITPRFRLRCAPAQDAPDRHLAVLSIECPSPTGMTAEREQGMRITASLMVVFSGNTPRNADVVPLLDALQEHRLVSQTKKRSELAQKSGLDTWTRVLALQRRLLNEFQLPYEDWEQVDGGSALLVELAQEQDGLDLSGDQRLCMTASSGRGSVLAGYFEEIEGKTLKIGLASDADPAAIAKRGKITLDNFQMRSVLARQEDAFRRLKFSDTVNPSLYRLLTDPSALETDRVTVKQFWDQDLDPPQQDVVRKALATKDIFLVQGPPGTGKTTAIVEIVRQILHGEHQPQRVLIASQSNVAVNHALRKLLETEPGLSDTIVRVGREEKAGDTIEWLLPQQLARWTGQVATKSRAYLETMRRELTVDSQLAECVNTLEEYQTRQARREQLEQEIQAARIEYDTVCGRVRQLGEMLAALEQLRERMNALLAVTPASDASMTQMLEAFQTDYLSWGEQFLGQASEAGRLSLRRVELQDSLDHLKAAARELGAQMEVAAALVRETLRDMFHVDLVDASAQQAYVDQNLAKQQTRALKLGRVQKVAQDWERRVCGDVTDFTAAYLYRSRVIGATCIGIAARGDVSELSFDWVIVDEAGRATHPELVVPLVRGRRLVLVGDHRQLPPILDREITDELLEEIEISRQELSTSLFQDLMEGAPETVTGKLLMQYRMHPAIGDLVGRCFYDGELQNGRSADERRHGLTWCPTAVAWYSTHKLKHHEERQEGYSYQNNAEVEAVIKLIDRIEADLANRNLQKKIGVITGYMAQKQLLRQRIPEGASPRWPHLTVEVNTVDAYQGREMDYIVYSVVRSNAERQIGFLRDERRLNVALSRARELLVVVGDRETAETANTRGHPNPFAVVLQHIRDNRAECLLEDLTQ
jgi:hypothetical protein